MRRRIFALFLTMVVVMAAGAMVAQAQGQILRYGMSHADTGGMDPHLAPATNDKTVVDPLFNGLVRFQPGNMNPAYIQPDLAESWSVSDDGLVWTFKLREGVQFHHGYGELTAEDVVFSLTKAGDPDRSAFSIDYRIFAKIEAADRYTVVLTLHDPLPEVQVLAVLTDYQGGMIVSKAAVEAFGDGFRTNPIGTGPFKFESYVPRQYVSMSRNEEYFRGAPVLAGLIYRFMPESRSRQAAFLAGELDMIEGLREQWWIEEIMRQPGVNIDVVGPGEMRTLHFNLNRPPLDDLRVRQALAYLIDRDEIRLILGENVTLSAVSAVPPGYMASLQDLEPYDYDPVKAQQLLTEAGFPDGVDLGRVVVTERDALRVPMEIVQEQLDRAGVRMDMQVVDHNTFHAQIREDLSAMVMYGAARFPTPDQYLTQFYHSLAVIQTPTAVTNFSHYGVLLPGVDHLIDGARIELDTAKQVALWEEAQRQINVDLPTYPIYVLMLVFVRSDRVDLGYDFESTLALAPQFNELTRLLD